MAENRESTDADVGIDTNDFASDLALPLGIKINEDQRFGTAIANERLILEIARILKSVGDFNVEVEQEVRNAEAEGRRRELKRRVSVKDYFSSCLKKVFDTLDVVLDWLEQSAKNAKDEIEKKREDKIQPCSQGDKTDGESKDHVDGKQESCDELYQKKEGVLRGLYHITGKLWSS
jgi:hypothetical protein